VLWFVVAVVVGVVVVAVTFEVAEGCCGGGEGGLF